MSQDLPQFRVINEEFDCQVCSRRVPRAQQTCRDHCPWCLHSLHVDVNPGDRAANCGGILRPVGYATGGKKGTMIHYKCDLCGAARVNRFLDADSEAPDDVDALLALPGKTK